MAEIGEPERIIEIDPIKLPDRQPAPAPEKPVEQPEKEPARIP